MKPTEARQVGQIISEAIEATGQTATYERYRICYLWPEVVGPWINSQTTRRYVEGDKLHVYIASAPLRSELSFSLERLTDALNKAIGHEVIKGIVLH